MENRIKLNAAETESMLTVCLLAAFADGGKSEVERAAIKAIMDNLKATDTNHAALYQRVLLGQVALAQAAQPLERMELRQFAYEMAVSVCEADNLLTPREKSFLDQLRQVLRLDTNLATRIEKDAEAVAFPDLAVAAPATTPVEAKQAVAVVASATTGNDIDDMILNSSILNGALELMPQSLSTLAIIPLQMKLVYRIGKKYGYEVELRPHQGTPCHRRRGYQLASSRRLCDEVVRRVVRQTWRQDWQIRRHPGDQLRALLRRHLRHRPDGAKLLCRRPHTFQCRDAPASRPAKRKSHRPTLEIRGPNPAAIAENRRHATTQFDSRPIRMATR